MVTLCLITEILDDHYPMSIFQEQQLREINNLICLFGTGVLLRKKIIEVLKSKNLSLKSKVKLTFLRPDDRAEGFFLVPVLEFDGRSRRLTTFDLASKLHR